MSPASRRRSRLTAPGEIFDYDSSKPYFEQWSAEALAASRGKSLGAVRAMHAPIAAGKLTDIAFDDDAKRVTVVAKIVDDDEWRKVQEGVYTGFSQGGRYVKRWPDPETGLTRYTAEPHEISLVDLPCLPDATFDVVKNGVVEKRGFAARPEAKRELPAKEREKDAEAGVAMPDGSYPIKSAKDVENAVMDYNRSGQKPDVKAHIIARAKAIGAESALPEDWTKPTEKSAPQNAPDALVKAAKALSHAVMKLEAAADENALLRKALRDLSPAVADLGKRIAALEAQPLPPKAALRAIAKSADRAGDARDQHRRRRHAARRPARPGARACAHQAQPRQPGAAPLLSGAPKFALRDPRPGARIADAAASARRRPRRSGPSPCSRRRSVNPLDASAAARFRAALSRIFDDDLELSRSRSLRLLPHPQRPLPG